MLCELEYLSKKKDIILSCRFVCCKEGLQKTNNIYSLVNNHIAKNRTDCKVRNSLALKNIRFFIREFVEDHNHPSPTSRYNTHTCVTLKDN